MVSVLIIATIGAFVMVRILEGKSKMYVPPKKKKVIDGIPVAEDLPIEDLLREVTARGGSVRLVSGYRDPELQASLFKRAVKRYGSEEKARKWVAPPGSSQHQSGYAVDIMLEDISNDSRNAERIAGTRTFAILKEVAESQGWKNYVPEPWHWSRMPTKEGAV